MPSPNPRIQVAASPDLYAQIKTLAKGRNVTLSNMVQELCLHALKTDVIRAEYQHACDTYGEVPVQEDKRVRPEVDPGSKAMRMWLAGTTLPAASPPKRWMQWCKPRGRGSSHRNKQPPLQMWP